MNHIQCPKCNIGSIVRNEYGYNCNHSSFLDNFVCDFYVWNSWYALEITEEILKAILESGENGLWLENLLSSEGNIFSSYVFYNHKINKLDFVDSLLGVQCPKCQGKILKNKFGYFCENKNEILPHEEQCSVALFKDTNRGILLDDSLAIRLLKGEKTKFISNFSNSNGTTYGARLFLNQENFSLEVDYKICDCPKCKKGYLTLANNRYVCTNYLECDFKEYKEIRGYQITIKNILDLVAKRTAGDVICKSTIGEEYKMQLLLSDQYKIYFKKM